ncbi:alkaline phosphodiesterase I [alpha proteobacterium U9-1i]|nr:alkaline phosphodiesterase I [alpha proteobacterium U9-1i]
MIRLALALAALVFVSACTHTREASPAPLILVSIDGFRADYLNRGVTPTLSRLAAEGARASMRPSFPSKTFPNHYTIVTGLRPDHHGVINNRMEDPERPGVVFSLSDVAVTSDPIWWRDGVPIWVTAERQGVRTATMFWPGSDFELHGSRPSEWRAFDMGVPSEARVDTLLSWFDAPADEQPRFATLYFDIVDTAGHTYGPHAPETNAAVALADAAIMRLVDGLAARGVSANLVIVADHGMAEVSEDRLLDLDAMAPATIAHIVWDGPFAGIAALPGHEAELEAALVGRRAHDECWRRGELPARLHYGTHRRTPHVVCLADIGWRYRSATIPHWAGAPSRGDHGFDNAAPDMAAVFVAHGPAFRRGVALAPFDNVSVYPLLTRLIGVTPEANDGSIADIAPALRDPR